MENNGYTEKAIVGLEPRNTVRMYEYKTQCYDRGRKWAAPLLAVESSVMLRPSVYRASYVYTTCAHHGISDVLLTEL
jgi:hypothetical protein